MFCRKNYLLSSPDPGADPGGKGVDWVASHPPWVCSVHNTAFSDLLEQTILVSKVYDEMQIHHSDRVNSEYFRTKKPNGIACFILFMIVIEH